MRIALREAGIEAHLLEQGRDASLGIGPARDPMDGQRLGEHLVHRHARVERAVRVLKHDLHAAPQRAQRACPERDHVLAVDRDAPGVGLDQSEDRPPHGGLAAARFAHEPQRLSGCDRERHVVHRAHDGTRRAEPEQPALARKVLDESPHVHERRRHGCGVRRRGSVSSQQRTVWVPGSAPPPASSRGGASARPVTPFGVPRR